MIEQDNDKESKKEISAEEDLILNFTMANLSTILNAIDGVRSVHGRILIITTNCINDLDPALIRPGRIDLKINLGYVNNYILEQFFKSFYPEYIVPDNFIVREGISSAYLQNLIFENLKRPENVLQDLVVNDNKINTEINYEKFK